MRYKELAKWFDEAWPCDACVPRQPPGLPGEEPPRRFPPLVSGIYCLAVEVCGDIWTPIYVGKAFDIRNRMQLHLGQVTSPQSEAHKQWFEFADRVVGMPFLLVRRLPGPAVRAYQEVLAIHALRPIMNSSEHRGFKWHWQERIEAAIVEIVEANYDVCVKMRNELESKGLVFPRPMLPRDEWIAKQMAEAREDIDGPLPEGEGVMGVGEAN